ncbi:hypothetical protein B0G76_7816 [Paraburkholderia sp. BL23I1N1]|nr:hypothetical protein B0G76_7816 [Paraburkholderia sp. BL23I1N1]
MAEKCWAFGVTFLRDRDFAADLSLFCERRDRVLKKGARQIINDGMSFF